MRRAPYHDEHFCFFMDDFKPGDSLIMLDSKTKERIRGVVTSVDIATKHILWVDGVGIKHRSTVNEVVYLNTYDSGWL